jgi:hypothetical protein
MGLPSEILATFAGAHDLLGISHSGWSLESLPECVSNESSQHGMVSIGPAMDVIQQLLTLFGMDVALQDLV